MQKWLSYLTIGLFAGYILYLHYTNKLNFYIHPRYTDFAVTMSWITFSFVFLFLLHSLQQLLHAQGSIKINLPKIKLTRNNIWGLLISLPLAITLALGFLLPVKPLSVATASQRIIDLNALRSNEMSTADLFIRNTRNYSLGDWIIALNNNPDPSLYAGKEVRLSGFIFSPDDKPQEFYLSRFAITCCAVDARPIGLKVNYSWQNQYQQNQWLEIEGEFAVAGEEPYQEIIIKPTKVSVINVPDQPYIF
jgi:putative membrane protein